MTMKTVYGNKYYALTGRTSRMPNYPTRCVGLSYFGLSAHTNYEKLKKNYKSKF